MSWWERSAFSRKLTLAFKIHKGLTLVSSKAVMAFFWAAQCSSMWDFPSSVSYISSNVYISWEWSSKTLNSPFYLELTQCYISYSPWVPEGHKARPGLRRNASYPPLEAKCVRAGLEGQNSSGSLPKLICFWQVFWN